METNVEERTVVLASKYKLHLVELFENKGAIFTYMCKYVSEKQKQRKCSLKAGMSPHTYRLKSQIGFR